jgi:hypothetical protein
VIGAGRRGAGRAPRRRRSINVNSAHIEDRSIAHVNGDVSGDVSGDVDADGDVNIGGMPM